MTGTAEVSNPQVIYEGRAGVKGLLLETITSWLSNNDGPEPGSRWSALWTNDLDAGEDRRGMGAGDRGRASCEGGWHQSSIRARSP